MKKIISVILSLVMIFSLATPAFASSQLGLTRESNVPIIYISGDSNELSYDNGTKTFAVEDILNIFKNSEDGNIKEAAFNILYPFILKGIAFNQWDDYYDAVYKEISEVFDPVRLDENGNVKNDCGLQQWQKDDIANAMVTDRASNGTYTEKSYRFYYDWRLDPIELADQLHDYIEGVKSATHHDKVGLSVRCLGSNVVLAYIAKYGTDSLQGVGIDVSTSMGADFISGALSGKFGIDGNSISRLVTDFKEIDGLQAEIADFVSSTLDLLDNTGVLDTLTDVARKQLYEKIEYGIISALALSTLMTYPGYWAVVSVEDFDTALNYVFGEEGSEKRETYKGLIEKITFYNETIKKNVYPIMNKLKENDVNTCIISKYGIQMAPVLKDGSLVGDEYVSVYHSSFGATTSNVYSTLSDEYISAQTEKGLEKYISPDKQVDASTCLFPDNTWFFKGVRHGTYTIYEVSLMLTVINAPKQLTVDDFDLSQFIVYQRDNDGKCVAMNEENCNTEYWEADDVIDHPQTKAQRLFSFLTSLFKWLKSTFSFFAYLINKNVQKAPET